eukprot:CAMPEP_0171600550 /NCGR_PEP_ID=MMETSP0990-20121206/4395_1 /TAXON_ID=483369 /ORGANISM="non described non described, Strain CCMP2098" /LENGTH=46 /DNA_ID= /DNA_START= /DNA_END= /DNA_ORIENTATION=
MTCGVTLTSGGTLRLSLLCSFGTLHALGFVYNSKKKAAALTPLHPG